MTFQRIACALSLDCKMMRDHSEQCAGEIVPANAAAAQLLQRGETAHGEGALPRAHTVKVCRKLGFVSDGE